SAQKGSPAAATTDPATTPVYSPNSSPYLPIPPSDPNREPNPNSNVLSPTLESVQSLHHESVTCPTSPAAPCAAIRPSRSPSSSSRAWSTSSTAPRSPSPTPPSAPKCISTPRRWAGSSPHSLSPTASRSSHSSACSI